MQRPVFLFRPYPAGQRLAWSHSIEPDAALGGVAALAVGGAAAFGGAALFDLRVAAGFFVGEQRLVFLFRAYPAGQRLDWSHSIEPDAAGDGTFASGRDKGWSAFH